MKFPKILITSEVIIGVCALIVILDTVSRALAR